MRDDFDAAQVKERFDKLPEKYRAQAMKRVRNFAQVRDRAGKPLTDAEYVAFEQRHMEQAWRNRPRRKGGRKD